MEIASWSVAERGKAERIEREVLQMVRVKMPKPALGPDEMPQGGYTETCALGAVSINKAEAFIDSKFDSLNVEEFD